MPSITRVPLSEIVVPSTRRTLRSVDGLAASMAEVGLLNPVTLTESKRLVAGLHRIEAARLLGWREIEARIVSLTELQRRVAELDENLERTELNELERAEQTAERKRLYEAIHPTAPKAPGRHKRNAEMISAFSKKQSGVEARTDRSVRHDVQIATRIPDDVRDAIRPTPMADRKADLIELSRLDEGTQRQVAKYVAEIPEATLKDAVTHIVVATPSTSTKAADDVAARWFKSMHGLWSQVNGIRDNGGITRLTAKWSAAGRDKYAAELDHMIEALTTIRREIVRSAA
jgi:ParB family chromosome partitioning protein